MAISVFVYIKILVVIHARIIQVNGGDCNTVFRNTPTFGNCQYRCHCKNDTQCNQTTGYCDNGCELGWMGPGCQYRNIAQNYSGIGNIGGTDIESEKAKVAVDGNVSSCARSKDRAPNGYHYWRIEWKIKYRIVGLVLKIHREDVGNFSKFRVQTGSGSNNEDFNSACYTHGDTPVTTEMEIMCREPVWTRHLRIIHDKRNVKMRVCEVEIYGGRVVTFNKPTNQTSTNLNRPSWLTVDGQVNASGIEANDTCSLTTIERNPYWLVDFQTMYVVQSLYFYGGRRPLHPEYREFKIFLLNDNSNRTEIYNDTGSNADQYQPMVIEQANQITARHLKIVRPVQSDVLAVCEVIAFAECPTNKCGWDCKSDYYCAAEITGKYQMDGVCPHGCSGRWTGRDQKCNIECNATTWGDLCNNKCGNCNCNFVTGHCEHGCNGPWYPPDCVKECNDTSYGTDCSQTCGHCKNNERCNIAVGNCTNGCMSGWQPPLCKEVCSAGRYGENCIELCGHCNGGSTCNASTGVCEDGCSPGYLTSLCNTICPEGYFGFECKELCSDCGDGEYCDHISGVCNSCNTSIKIETCQQFEQTDHPPEPSQAGTIAGVMVTVLVAFGIGVAVVFVIRRRSNICTKFKESEMGHQITLPSAIVTADEQSDTEQSEDNVYQNAAIVHGDIDVSDLRDVCASAKRNQQPFYNDFETLPHGLKKNASVARDPSYKSKNRYKAMYPYNVNRVQLPMICGDHQSTYINASYINGYDISQKYIAAQGALKTTISDVWRMVWTENISSIVMLTNCVELGKIKCAKYWPDEEAEVHDDISVVLEKSELFSDFIIRTFLCTKVSSGEKRTVVQFHYTAWPDKDVPDTSLSLVQFWRAVRYNQSSQALPWLVHCSAGVGRTGAFIALDFLYDMGTILGTVNVLDTVNTLRKQRLDMVQTKKQYVYVHETAAEVLCPIGSICKNDDFDELFQSLISDDGRATEKLEKEFECVNIHKLGADNERDGIYCNVTQSKSVDAELKENIGKSRDPNIIPNDLHRPNLSMAVSGRNDFINAVYIPTFRTHSKVILTQIPLKHTVVDFLRLIWEYNVSIVVLLEEHMDEECSYYPMTKKSKHIDVFTTELKNEEMNECYALRTIVVSLKERNEHREFKLFQIKSWPKNKPTPIDTRSMLRLISDIDSDEGSKGRAPIVVQCLDGAKKSGVFSTLWCLLEKHKFDNEIAVAETVRMSRVRRKQIIDNFEQYKYCYKVMHDYLDSLGVYENAMKSTIA